MTINHSETKVKVEMDDGTERLIKVPAHGGTFHSVCILIAEIICLKRGYTLKDTESFSRMNNYPGIPDVYVEYKIKRKNNYGQLKTYNESVCIEIETHPTTNMSLKKNMQFTRPGIREPIIIDMNTKYKRYIKSEKLRGIERGNDIDWIEAYIDSEILI
jgi:hypothetical protein